MKESDKREKILKKMKRWPWNNVGVLVLDEEETQVVIKRAGSLGKPQEVSAQEVSEAPGRKETIRKGTIRKKESRRLQEVV